MSEFMKGDRIKHLECPHWGLGQVLADSSGGRVNAFFIDAGEKTLMLSHTKLLQVEGEEAQSLFLDNLAQDRSGKVKRFRSLKESVEDFEKLFPGGFHGSDYDEWERKYKVQGHQLIMELLDKQGFAKLLDNQDYKEVCDRASKVSNKLNLIFPNEKMAMKDGLKLEVNQQPFAEKLYELLYGEGEMKERFTGFASCLKQLGAAKWPIVSYFQFVRYPEKHMFVKPLVTQNVADIIGFELNYDSALNWLTYESVQKMAEYLRGRLAEMKPRDMIDVQTFMWCIDPSVFDDYVKAKESSGNKL